MRGISRDVDAAHPGVDEVGMSLVLVGYWHEVNEGIVVKRTAFNALKGRQALRQTQTKRNSQISEIDICVNVAHWEGVRC